MKNLEYQKAEHVVSIDLVRSPEDVFAHLVDLSNWWPEDFAGENVRLGGEFILKIGGEHFSKNRVVEFVPGKRLVWLTTESQRKADGYDWSGTKFIFELTPKSDHTQLTFTYDGVVLENETERLVQVCDMCINDLFYNFLMNGSAKPALTHSETRSKSYTAIIEVANSPDEIFERITNDVAKWWGGKDLSGSSTHLNDEFIVDHPGAHYSKQRLVEVIPVKKVVWHVTESKLSWLKDEEEWTNTKMVFEISAKSYSCLLHFTHEGLVPEKECYARCSEGWSMVIKDRLYNLIMYGKAYF